jgi:predicted nuclease of predicted toxin-antitoxin system
MPLNEVPDRCSASPGTLRVAERAGQTGAIVVSKDEDFVTLRAADRFALLWLRCGNVTRDALTRWLEDRWPDTEGRLESGERMIELH